MIKTRSRRAVAYTSCPDCPWWSVGVQANGRIVRHTTNLGYVEKVGPGTRHPGFRATLCKGSGKKIKFAQERGLPV